MYNPTKPTKGLVVKLIQSTWDNPYITVFNSTYAVFKKNFSSYEIDHTDGIGTKGYYHWQKKSFKNAVIDALAMNLNDLALMRAVPYKLQNHIVLPEDDNASILKIISELVKECKKRKIAITGGETSIQATTDGLDIGITLSGLIRKVAPNTCKTGDILIGLKSNGIHSNGFTKVREIFKDEYRTDFTKPTKIYSDVILSLSESIPINGMMHITGGAFTKLKDLLKGQDAVIHRNHALKPQKIFREMYERGVTDEEMYKTFNCGIGFVISIDPKYVNNVIQKTGGDVIGNVVKGTGKVVVESQFSDKKVVY